MFLVIRLHSATKQVSEVRDATFLFHESDSRGEVIELANCSESLNTKEAASVISSCTSSQLLMFSDVAACN